MASERATSKHHPSHSHVGSNNIKHVVLGDLLFQTWFQSFYPQDLVAREIERLYICRWCFRYTGDVSAYVKHMRVCGKREKASPPGAKVYEHAGYSVWEVDGEEDKLFAQNLCLFAKLFVDHKTVFFDVASFLFYLLVFSDPVDPDWRILGFFSKEKMSWDANNLACILIFPPYQHKSLGRLLISVSYRLGGDSASIGGPERPLSEMGWKSYSRFWKERLLRYLLLGSGEQSRDTPPPHRRKPKGSKKRPASETMTVQDMSLAVGMLTEDVITTLKDMGVTAQDRPPGKRRKTARHDGGSEVTDDEQMVQIRKSALLEWSKAHSVSLQDPVRQEGFGGMNPA